MGFFDQIASGATDFLNNTGVMDVVNPAFSFGAQAIQSTTGITPTQQLELGAVGGTGAAMAGGYGIAGAGPAIDAGLVPASGVGVGSAGAAGAGAAASGGFFSGATPWLVGAGVLGQLYTGQQSSEAMRYAADKSARASEAALAFQQQAYNAQEPYREAGAVGLEGAKRLASDPNAYSQSPYAHWLQQQGEKSGVAASQATGGMSGGALAAMSQQAQGQAGAGFSDQYNRFASLAGLGQAATATQGNIAGNIAGNIMQHAGDTQGNTAMAIAGQQGTTFNNILNTVSMGAGMSSGNWGNRPSSTTSPAQSDREMYNLSPPSGGNWNSSMPNQAPETNWYT